MGFLLLSCILFVLCSFLRFKIIERNIPLNFVQTIFAQCKAEKRHASARSAPTSCFYTHANAKLTSEGVCRPLFYIHMRASSTLD